MSTQDRDGEIVPFFPEIHPPNDAHLLLIIGQLMEATKAAADSLRELGQETAANTAAHNALQRAITSVENVTNRLHTVVFGGPGETGLVRDTLAQNQKLLAITEDVRSTEEAIRCLKDQLGTYNTTQAASQSRTAFAWRLTEIAAWIVTTAVAVYTVIKQSSP